MADSHGQPSRSTRGGRTSSHDDESRCVHSQYAGGWVRALAVATFDVGTGHTLEQVYPSDSLDEGDRQRIRMLAMPDCNTTQIGDCFYCFRTRKSHRLPLLSSSLLEQSFEYCYAFFRQEKNKECARGMFQKSVVLVSRYPYVNLFERLVKVIGPLYFAHGPAVLEAVFASLEEWPAPCPGALCPLPFLSETVMFQVPDIDMPSQVAATYSSPSRRRVSTSGSLIIDADERPHGSGNSAGVSEGGGGGEGGGRTSISSVRTTDAMETLKRIEASTASVAVSLDLGGGGALIRKNSDQNTTPTITRTSTTTTPGEGEGSATKSAIISVNPDAVLTESDLARYRGNNTVTGSADTGSSVAAGAAVQKNTLRKLPPEEQSGRTGSPRHRDRSSLSLTGLAGSASHDEGGGGTRVALWSGAARSPGVLLSPGLQEGAGGIDGPVASRRRSSLGAGSLASVVKNSNSESWLTTPKTASSPLLLLDSNSGSNLAQSCYYVADRDSEEDDDSSLEDPGQTSESSDSDLGWLVREGTDKGKEIVFPLEEGTGNPEAVPQEPQPAGAGTRAVIAPERTDVCHAGVKKVVEQGDGLSAAVDSVQLSPPPVTAVVLSGQSRAGNGAGGGGTAILSTAGLAETAPPTASRSTPSKASRSPVEQPGGTSSAVATTEKAGQRAGTAAVVGRERDRDRDRANSLSPVRSTPVAATLASAVSHRHSLSRLNPPSLGAKPLSRSMRSSTTGSCTGGTTGGGTSGKKTLTSISSSGRPWSGLRAWADSGPEDPWHAPPPICSPFALRSKLACNSPAAHGAGKGVWPPAVVSPAKLSKVGSSHEDEVSDLVEEEEEKEKEKEKEDAVGGGREEETELVPQTVRDTTCVRTTPAREQQKAAVGRRGQFARSDGKTREDSAAATAAATASATDARTTTDDTVGVDKDSAWSRPSSVRSSAAEAVVVVPKRQRSTATTTDGGGDGGGGVWELLGASAGGRISRVGGGSTRNGKGSDEAVDAVVGVVGSERVLVGATAGGERERGRGAAVAAPEYDSEEERKVVTGGGSLIYGCPDAAAAAADDAACELDSRRAFVEKKKVEGEEQEVKQEKSKGGGSGEVGDVSLSSSGRNVTAVKKRRGRLSGDLADGRRGSWKSSPERRSIHIHRTARTLHGGRSPFAEMLLADEERFRAKQGLFQSIGLYSIFGKKLVEHLWLLWELVLTGGPTLVVGSSVGASSAAILGMVSLASPIYFGGDFRPHFTTFDPDYQEIVAAHDKVSKQQLWGSSVLGVQSGASGGDASGGFPSMLLGVINPIFLRTLSRWPNAIVLPGAAGRTISSNIHGAVDAGGNTSTSNDRIHNRAASMSSFNKLQRDLSEDSSTSSPRNRRCPTPKIDGLPVPPRPPPVRVQVIRAGASLDQVVGQDDKPQEPIIISRQQPVMVPDVAVLARLLDPGCPYSPGLTAKAVTAAAAAASTSSQASPSTPSSAGVAAMAAQAVAAVKGGKETKGQWKDSLRAINDVILRRHFADLTRSFLAPFDRYFRRAKPSQQLSPWQQQALARLSVYTEPELLMARFSQEEMLTEMFVAGPPKEFAHVQWETLYRRFMESPNFRPWFTTQRMEGVECLREYNRMVCLRTAPAALVECCAPARLPQLLGKIKAAIAREWQNKDKDVDWELLERMEVHQAAVDAAVSSAAKNTSGAATP